MTGHSSKARTATGTFLPWTLLLPWGQLSREWNPEEAEWRGLLCLRGTGSPCKAANACCFWLQQLEPGVVLVTEG